LARHLEARSARNQQGLLFNLGPAHQQQPSFLMQLERALPTTGEKESSQSGRAEHGSDRAVAGMRRSPEITI
jgi:hypothetical protein